MSEHGEKPGDALERLVAVIERATATSENVIVERKKRVRDKDTGRLREHDVVLTFKEGHHEIVMALECKERSRKTGVPDIEAFYAKCQRTGISRGIVVSKIGFTKTAIVKAASYNIGCLSLEDAEGFDWCLAPGMEVQHREAEHVRVRFEPMEPVPDDAKILDENGVELTEEKVRNIGNYCIARLSESPAPDEEPDKLVVRRFFDESPGFTVQCPDGRIVVLKRAVIDVHYKLKISIMSFEFMEYIDRASGNSIYTAAVGRLELPGISGHVAMIRDEAQGIKISFIPQAATALKKAD